MTDPRDDRIRIERTKGGLLNDSFRWILDDPEFQRWRSDHQSRLLWIKGDAGKGKTMLMIGIINELSRQVAGSRQSSPSGILSYFLCQGTDSRLNNATAILRGIIYLLVVQQPFLISHLRKKYDTIGRRLFEDTTAFYSLCEVFQQMLHDPRLTTAYLLVDALDECELGLSEFLDLIAWTASTKSVPVKWIISSRNRDDIEQQLGIDDSHIRLSLELNAANISRAIDIYIDYKVSQLVSLRHNEALQEQVRDQMRRKSDGTFLWVALVFEELRGVFRKNLSRVLEGIPKGLTPLYDRMVKQIQQLEEEHLQLCVLALSTSTLAFRPLHMLEIHTLAGLQEELPDLADLERIINMCSSFLTIRKDYIYFIHQSAKDYLTATASAIIFPAGRGLVHRDIFLRSLEAMSKTLRRDIYNLQDPGAVITDSKPDSNPLTPIEYSCVFWFDHLCEVDSQIFDYSSELSGTGRLFSFLKKHYLHWLESLSLMREVSSGVLTIRKLRNKVQVC